MHPRGDRMFDLGWTEIAVIVVVAVVVIGPKDLPAAVRGLAQQIAKFRRWAAEARGTLDEVVREAKLDEVRDQINEIRNFDLRSEVERAVDPTGDLQKTFRDFDTPVWTPPPPPKTAADIPDAPAFVPPQTLAPIAPPPPPPPPPAAPAFVPPSTAAAGLPPSAFPPPPTPAAPPSPASSPGETAPPAPPRS